MSKALLVCLRDPKQPFDFRQHVDLLTDALTPDNIIPRPTKVLHENGVHVAIFNPSSLVTIRGTNFCLGNMAEEPEDWWRSSDKLIDGTFALFRSNEDSVELINDVAASRTIWYAQTKALFIASTSQRAIVALLGSFEINRSAVAWLLSSGMLGPGNSWDQRITMLPSDSRLVLDRTTWNVSTSRQRTEAVRERLTRVEHERRFLTALEGTFERMGLDLGKWVLALSGGQDSRAILLFLSRKKGLRCITWGLEASQHDVLNDAYIARTLTNHFKLDFQYFETDSAEEPIERIFHRYFVAGEGRIDHISAYMDGFRIWKMLYEQGIEGVIRGDQGFAASPAYTSMRVKRYIGLMRLGDYSNLKSYKSFDLPEQYIDCDLRRASHESLPDWRDRLYLEYRLPTQFAALNDLKCPYVEIVNPMLSRRVINQIRTMPSSLKTNRRLFKKLIYNLSPDIPVAERPAVASRGSLLRSPSAMELIRDELRSTGAEAVLAKSMTKFIDRNMQDDPQSTSGPSVGSDEKSLLSRLITKGRNNLVKPDIDVNVLGFRAYMVARMARIFGDDAQLL